MRVVHLHDPGEVRWFLASGWSVDPHNSLYFVAPNGVIYDRSSWMLHARFSNRYPEDIHLTEIFTDEEYDLWAQNFNKN